MLESIIGCLIGMLIAKILFHYVMRPWLDRIWK